MNLSRRQFLGLLPAIPVAAMAVVKAKQKRPLVGPEDVGWVVRNGVGDYTIKLPLYPSEQAMIEDQFNFTIEIAKNIGTETVPCPDYRRFGSGVNIYTG
jgi:hypothetical protein